MSAIRFRSLPAACWALTLSGLFIAPGAPAQSRPPTTEEIGLDPGARRQLEEQRNAQQQRQQQAAQQQQQDQLYQDAQRQQQARQQADAAQGRAVLQTWQQRPPLAPERNPLLGRWNSQGNSGANRAGGGGDINALASALIGGLTGGMCDSMLGRGLIEFRPTTLVAIGPDGRERVKYHVQYRGGGSRVVVLPQDAATFTHMIIDFSGADRASVVAVGCVLVRAGGAGAAARPAQFVEAMPAPAQWELLGTSAANGGMDVYVARSAIQRRGSLAQMWDLWDFKTPRAFEGKRFLSARNKYEYDCAGARRRMLATMGFSEHMARGAVVGSGDETLQWEPIPPAGPLRDYWKTACGKA